MSTTLKPRKPTTAATRAKLRAATLKQLAEREAPYEKGEYAFERRQSIRRDGTPFSYIVEYRKQGKLK